MESLADIKSILSRHLIESEEGIVDEPPSRLRRGQAVEKDYFIMKVDLARSTALLRSRHKATYLKIIHAFLSTVDQITQYFGADPDQTEYAGDSVLAYFPANIPAENVLRAASSCKVAVEQLAAIQRDPQLAQINCRIVMHYATLLVARIGPRAGSILSAIGHPIHRVAKLEKEIGIGIGRATIEFQSQLVPANRKYLSAIYSETKVAPKPRYDFSAINPPHSAKSLADALQILSTPLYDFEERVQSTLVGYNLNWPKLKIALHLTER